MLRLRGSLIERQTLTRLQRPHLILIPYLYLSRYFKEDALLFPLYFTDISGREKAGSPGHLNKPHKIIYNQQILIKLLFCKINFELF